MVSNTTKQYEDIDLSELTTEIGISVSGAETLDGSGRSVSSAGDIDGDGYSEVIIYSGGASPNGKYHAGTVYVLYGKPSGFSNINLENLNKTEGFKILGAYAGEGGYGNTQISSAGDVNNDGYSDIIIGFPYAGINGKSQVGISYIIFGKKEGLCDIDLANLTNDQGFSISGTNQADGVGSSVSGAGDINGDRYADVIISSVRKGVYLIFGKKNFTDINIDSLNTEDGYNILIAQNGGCQSLVVSGAGDINKDGYSDFIISDSCADWNGVNRVGISYVIFGNSLGFSNIHTANLTSDQGFRILGNSTNDSSGSSASNAGDIDGDGYGDILVGASGASYNGGVDSGVVYIIYGKNKNIGDVFLGHLTQDQGFSVFIGAHHYYMGNIGTSVSNIGDINQDGFDDFIVGGSQGNDAYEAQSYVIFGGPKGQSDIDVGNLNNERGFKIIAKNYGDNMGSSVSGAGDFNGDGTQDIIIGAFEAPSNGKPGTGESYILYLTSSSNPPTASPTTLTPTSKPTMPTRELANVDLSSLNNEQGIITNGANSYDYSGESISSAGNFNGDGIDDLVIGAPGASPYGRLRGGVVYIIYGSSKNVNNIGLSNITSDIGIKILGAKENDYTGRLVSGAGDVNKDGYDDVIIHAPGYNSPSCAYLIYGGIDKNDIDLYNLNYTQGIKISGSSFGVEVIGGIGDINNDGHKDILVSGYIYGNIHTSTSYVIYGNNFNNDINLDNFNDQKVFVITRDSCSGVQSVSAAGDFNNDGYGDFAVNILHNDNNYHVEYCDVYVILGQQNFTNFNLNNLTRGFNFYLNEDCMSLGFAGDFNNDGRSDIIIGGVTNSTKTEYTDSYVLFGQSFGKNDELKNISLHNISTSQGVIFYGANYFDKSGYSVAGGRDVNGDGIDDIVIGIKYMTPPSGEIQAGGAAVVLGSEDHKNIDLANLSNKQGYMIYGSEGNAGFSVSMLDINGDGYADTAVAAPFADPDGGIYEKKFYAGTTYIITNSAATISPSSLPTLSPSVAPSNFPTSSPFASGAPSMAPTAKPDNSTDTTDNPTIINQIVFPLEISLGSIFGLFVTFSLGAYRYISNNKAVKIISESYEYKFLNRNDIDAFRTKLEEFNLWARFKSLMVRKKIGLFLDVDGLIHAIYKDTTTNMVEEINIDAILQRELAALNVNNLYLNLRYHLTQGTRFTLSAQSKYKLDTALINGHIHNLDTDLGWIQAHFYKKYRNEYQENIVHRDYRINHGLEPNDNEEIADLEANLLPHGHIDHIDNRITVLAAPIIEYANPLLNHPQLLEILVQAQRIGGINAVNKLLEQGDSADSYYAFINNIETDGMRVAVEKLIMPAEANRDQSLSLSLVEKTSVNKQEFSTISNFATSLFSTTRQLIEYIPMLKYMGQNIVCPLIKNYLPEYFENITFHKIFDNNILLFSSHLVIGHLGALHLPEKLINDGLIKSTIESGAFGTRLMSSHYLQEYKYEMINNDMKIDSIELAKYCASTTLAYTAPALATCILYKLVIPEYQCVDIDLNTKLSFAGSECYSFYKAIQVPEMKPTTTDLIMPYIVNSITAVASYINYGNPVAATTAVVVSDYMSRFIMDRVPYEIKEEFIDPMFDCMHDIIHDTTNNVINVLDVNSKAIGDFFFTSEEL